MAVLFLVGSGLQCFECDLDKNHICSKIGTHEGQKITCSPDENACIKNIGGKRTLNKQV